MKRVLWKLVIVLAAGAAGLGACGDHEAADCTDDSCDSIGRVGSPRVDSGLPSGGSGGSAAGGTGGAVDAGEDATAGGQFPCEIQTIFENKCWRCHTEPPANGAPFSFVTWDRMQEPYGSRTVAEAMLNAVDLDFMPATFLDLDPPVEVLTSAEKEELMSWLEAGAPEAGPGEACE